MTIKSRSTEVVTRIATVLDHPDHGELTLIDYQGENGQIFDAELRNSKGESLDDPAILEEVEEFVDNQVN